MCHLGEGGIRKCLNKHSLKEDSCKKDQDVLEAHFCWNSNGAHEDLGFWYLPHNFLARASLSNHVVSLQLGFQIIMWG